jgi:hypothetical protein
MRYYLRLGEGGLFYVDSTLNEQEFNESIKAGHDFQPLYDSDGNHMKTYPSGLFMQADVLPAHPLIAYNGKGAQYKSEQRGFVVIPFPYDKKEIFPILDKLGAAFDPNDSKTVEAYLTEHGLDFLNEINCNVFNGDLYGKCIIDESENAVFFISKYGLTLQGNEIMFGTFDGSIYKLSDRVFKLYYIPTADKGVVYNMYK